MTQDSKDIFARAYATLSSLRKNIDQMRSGDVPETYVREFHRVLDKLSSIDIDVSDFRIPESEVKPKAVFAINDATAYSREKYVGKPFLLTKIDAILGYFEITASEKPRSIGFSQPNEK